VVGFIGEFQDDVYQARHVPADGGSTQVGINENTLDDIIGEAFPVPAMDQVTIPFTDLKEDVTLKVMDGQGRLVFEERLSSGTQQTMLDVSSWAAGLYTYQALTVAGASTKAKMLQVQ
jgi:hypothetical protein